MKILTKEVVKLNIKKVEVISEDNVELGERVLNCTFRPINGLWRSYTHSFSMIEKVEDLFNPSAKPEEIVSVINSSNELSEILNKGKMLGIVDDRFVVIDLDGGYDILVNIPEYEAFTGKCFDKHSVYQEAKKIIFSYPIEFRVRVFYSINEDTKVKEYTYREMGLGYPAYYSEKEIEELEEALEDIAREKFENDFIEL
jgi:hypothetical protein